MDAYQELELLAIEGRCPICGSDDVTAIDYPEENQIWFECFNCYWDKTYRLSDAKEAGYYLFWGEVEDKDGAKH